MKVNKILETCLYVSDLEKAQHFYSDVLGLEPFKKAAERHVFFKCGKSVFLLFNPKITSEPDQDVPSHGAEGDGHVAFAISEKHFQRWKDHLLKKKVMIEKELVWGNGAKSIYFRDPDRNSIELVTPRLWGIAEEDSRQ